MLASRGSMALGAQSARDVYANLLADSRGMRRDRASARERWYAELRVDHKETALFELEMLLKGFACFGNVRNHPGPARKTPSVAHDFVEELRVMRMGIDRAIEQSRELLGERERAFGFSRYLETVLPGDAERTRLLKEQLTQDTPQEALFLLRNAFGNFAEITDGLLRLGLGTRGRDGVFGRVSERRGGQRSRSIEIGIGIEIERGREDSLPSSPPHPSLRQPNLNPASPSRQTGPRSPRARFASTSTSSTASTS